MGINYIFNSPLYKLLYGQYEEYESTAQPAPIVSFWSTMWVELCKNHALYIALIGIFFTCGIFISFCVFCKVVKQTFIDVKTGNVTGPKPFKKGDDVNMWLDSLELYFRTNKIEADSHKYHNLLSRLDEESKRLVLALKLFESRNAKLSSRQNCTERPVCYG